MSWNGVKKCLSIPNVFGKISEIIHDLNYVVIAIGNDNEGMALAIDLYEYAYRYRKDCFNDLGFICASMEVATPFS